MNNNDNSNKSSAVAEMGDHLATIDMGRKVGALPLWGELLPHLTQCHLSQGLPPYQVVSWSMQLFGNNRHRLKIGGCATFGGREAGSPSNTMWPGPRPTKWHLDPSNLLATIQQRHRQTNRRWANHFTNGRPCKNDVVTSRFLMTTDLRICTLHRYGQSIREKVKKVQCRYNGQINVFWSMRSEIKIPN